MNPELQKEFIKIAEDVFSYLKRNNHRIFYKQRPRLTVTQSWHRIEEEEVPDYTITFLANCDDYLNKKDLSRLNELFLEEYPFIIDFIKTSRGGIGYDIHMIFI